jgi:hypothetical protein
MQINRQNPTAARVSGWNVPPGTASSPSAKSRHRLSAPQRWWRRSIARTAVLEIRSLLFRMKAYIHEPFLRRGFPLQLPDLENCGPVFGGENTFVDSCNKDMRLLSQKYRWATHLDQQMAAEAYRRGAEWAARTLRSG